LNEKGKWMFRIIYGILYWGVLALILACSIADGIDHARARERRRKRRK